MAKQERKPLRERVAERKRQEARKARDLGLTADKTESDGKPQSKEAARRMQDAVRWHQVQTAGSVIQWGALLVLIVEMYFVWTANPGDETRWTWIIVYAIIFGLGRVLQALGNAQLKRYR